MGRDLQKVIRAIEDLEFDFADFDIERFVRHVAHRRSRTILLNAVKLDEGITGLCASGPIHDYIFYKRDTPALHQTHIILHEIGHIVLNHAPTSLDFGDLTVDAIVRQLRNLSRLTLTPDIEWEAEQFAFQVQSRCAANRQRRMPVTSIGAILPYTTPLMLDR